MRAIGLMSGTSMDGIDVALIETDGERIEAFGPTDVYAYRDDDRTLLREAVEAAASLQDRSARPGVLAEAEAVVTDRHALAVENYLKDHELNRSEIDVVGFHGQTVLHRPDEALTVQLGDGAGLANRLGLPVVFDFRARDMKAGGQGAPLVPIYHRALVEAADLPGPAVIVNLGGVANITFIGQDGALLAFDTGPGNALIDDWMRLHTDKTWDEDGALAAQGHTDGQRLEALLSDSYFLRQPPKSLDRNDFSLSVVEGLSPQDGAATLTAFTVASVICGLAHLPATPQIFVLSGGGVRNKTLVANLRKLLPSRIDTAEAQGWNADAIEAQAFAYLAARSLTGLPITFPGTTGIAEPMTGGVLVKPEPAIGTRGGKAEDPAGAR